MAEEQKPAGWLFRRFAPLLALVMLVAACGGGADSDALAESEAARQAAEERVAELEAQVDDLEARISGFASEQDAVEAQPNIETLVGLNGLTTFAEDIDVDFVSLNLSGVAASGAAEDGLENLFSELGFPSSMMSRIGNTRALDGTQTADGDNASAYWTYHPDDGLSIVIELDG